MKKIINLLLFTVLFFGCNKAVLPKPKNLIAQTKMEAIIYDMSLLEAIKSQVTMDKNKFSGKTKDYIYKKYKIDSLQFVKSNQYYAAWDIVEYKKMFDRVKDKINAENEKLGGSKTPKSEGIIK